MPDNRPKLTCEQMLAKLPPSKLDAEGKETVFLTTPQVQDALGGVHETTIYRYVQQGRLSPHRVLSRGRASMYPRGEVETLIRSMFVPVPVSKGIHDQQGKLSRSRRAGGARRR